MIKLTPFYFSLLSILVATSSSYATGEEQPQKGIQRKFSVTQQVSDEYQQQIMGGLLNQRSAEKIRKLTQGKEELSALTSPRQPSITPNRDKNKPSDSLPSLRQSPMTPTTSSKPITIKKPMGVAVLPQVLSPRSSPSTSPLLSPRSQEETSKKRGGMYYGNSPLDLSAVDPSVFNDTVPTQQEEAASHSSVDQ